MNKTSPILHRENSLVSVLEISEVLYIMRQGLQRDFVFKKCRIDVTLVTLCESSYTYLQFRN
jgi:hypothetical protein